MTTSRDEVVSTEGGDIPLSVDLRGSVTDDDVRHLLASLTRAVEATSIPARRFDVLLTVRHDRDAGAQARARVTLIGDDGDETEHEVYAGSLRNAISEIELRLSEQQS